LTPSNPDSATNSGTETTEITQITAGRESPKHGGRGDQGSAVPGVIKLAAAIAVLATIAFFGREASSQLPAFAAWVRSLGVWGPLAFVGGYTVAAVFLLPAFLLTLAAGALWGFGLGVVYAMAGASFGASCAFLAARHLVRRLVERYVDRHPTLAAIDRAVESEGARLVFLLRLSPAVPYVLLNYVLGISHLRFRDYLIGLIGMTPTAAMYVYVGKVAGDIAVLATGAATPRGPAYYTLLTVGLIATIAATVLVTRAAKRALQQSVGPIRTP
jgi:uncharacterized membrane protein YdjX (TVP38/TMEM64 family)